MDDKALLAQIDQLAGQSYGQSGQLESDRAEALDRYNCQPYGDEVDGRSGVVATDLRDTVEWMMPKLLRIFIGGDEVATFDPKGPEDEQQAQQETDYVNHVILEKNNGFLIFSTWFRDALLQKNGYVKVRWEKQSDVLMEKYQGLPPEAAAMLLQDPDIEPVSMQKYPDPSVPLGAQFSPEQPPPMLMDIKVRRTKPYEFCKVEGVPPEEMRVIKTARDVSIQGVDFIEHRTRKTPSEIKQMGYDVSPDMLLDETEGEVSNARDLYNENGSGQQTRFVTYREIYIRVDYDGDDVAELRKVCVVGQTILHNEETDLIPFAAITPIIAPHRHIGVAYTDLVKEISRVKTVLMRGALDGLYLSNNGRYGVDVDKVNVDDMLISRPGGIVRVTGSPGEALFPFTHPQTLNQALEGISYVDKWRENATGINAYYQGMGDDVLNKTATGTAAMMTASEARVEAVARTFAETGVRDLMTLVHATTLKNATQEDKIKLRNQWVVVDPREWAKRDNLTISVGLGSGSKGEKIQGLMMLLQIQERVAPLGLSNRETVKNTMEELIKEMGYKVPEKFVAQQPPPPQPPPPPPPQIAAAQIKAQADTQIAQMSSQNDMQLADKKMQNDMQQAQAEAQMKAQLARYEAELEARTKIAIANIEIAAKERMAQYQLMHQPNLTDGQNMTAGPR